MFYKILFVLAMLIGLTGCEQKPHSNLDGKKLLEEKCSICHNLDLPPKTFIDEKAPPMMAVAFHIKDFIKVVNKSEKIPKAIDFVKDFVINPSVSKSFCDKKSLDSYGLMPSQKGKITQEELQAVAEYMFKRYTIENLTEAQAIRKRLKKMPKGKRIAVRYNCLGCHKAERDLVGPSFSKIAKRYKNSIKQMRIGIKKGSKSKWKGYRGAVMPAFGAKMSRDEIKAVAKWIAAMQ